MTRAETIKWLSNLKMDIGKTQHQELWHYEQALDEIIKVLEQEPIIHCKDCKHWHEWENGAGSCHRSDIMWVGSDYCDYCSFAEKRGSDER